MLPRSCAWGTGGSEGARECPAARPCPQDKALRPRRREQPPAGRHGTREGGREHPDTAPGRAPVTRTPGPASGLGQGPGAQPCCPLRNRTVTPATPLSCTPPGAPGPAVGPGRCAHSQPDHAAGRTGRARPRPSQISAGPTTASAPPRAPGPTGKGPTVLEQCDSRLPKARPWEKSVSWGKTKQPS